MPTLVPPAAKCMEKCYFFVPMQEFEEFYCHLATNSLLITAVNNRALKGRFKCIPKDRDSKQLDFMGRKIYTSSSIQRQIANHQALLSKYNFVNWTAMSKFVDQLPEASREEFQEFGHLSLRVSWSLRHPCSSHVTSWTPCPV